MVNKIERLFQDKMQFAKNKLIALEEKMNAVEQQQQKITSVPINSGDTEDPHLIDFANSMDAVINHFEYNCIFIQIYSVVEHFTVKICRVYNDKLGSKCFEDKRNFYLKDCKPFIRCQLGHNFGTDENWKKLQYYNDLRNLLVHNLGYNNNSSFFEKLIEDKEDIIVIDNENIAYIKNVDFLYRALEVSLNFFTELCDLIRKKTGEKNNLPPFSLFKG